MKNLIKAAIVATAALTATAATAVPYDFCKEYSEMVGNMAQARDVGVPASVVYEMAIKSSLPLDTMVELIQVVYVDGLTFSPDILKTVALTSCLN
tara:strand:- start:724 stop:1008 length:285 start_codon:yes stop_codon:yes gene_type:complete